MTSPKICSMMLPFMGDYCSNSSPIPPPSTATAIAQEILVRDAGGTLGGVTVTAQPVDIWIFQNHRDPACVAAFQTLMNSRWPYVYNPMGSSGGGPLVFIGTAIYSKHPILTSNYYFKGPGNWSIVGQRLNSCAANVSINFNGTTIMVASLDYFSGLMPYLQDYRATYIGLQATMQPIMKFLQLLWSSGFYPIYVGTAQGGTRSEGTYNKFREHLNMDAIFYNSSLEAKDQQLSTSSPCYLNDTYNSSLSPTQTNYPALAQTNFCDNYIFTNVYTLGTPKSTIDNSAAYNTTLTRRYPILLKP